MRHDVCFPLYVEVDEIYNLACPASPIHYQFDPVQTTKTSVHGAINMLGLAKRVKAKILQASTSEVYGDPQFIRKQKTIGAMSTRLDRAPATMKASAAPRPCSSITIASTGCRSSSPGYSIHMDRACIPTTAGWYRISSSRRFRITISQSTATAARRARSAT
jgi:hypothetical protein